MKLFTKKRVALAIGLLIVGIAGASLMKKDDDGKATPSRFRSAAVDTGTITQTVSATGTINPVALINVGSQVSGTVSELNADFNDRVKKGQVLLKLDPTIFNAQIRQGEAQVASAQASLRLAQANFERNGRLVNQNYVSGLVLDQSKRELDVARANLQLAEGALARSRADLNNSVIRAPIDGVIIKRTIDLGQTVAASFSTPNLFQIAQDLTKMQIDTNVSEADVGQLKPGLRARFVVDAYPEREFEATMRQFRLAANVVQNVVTYNVVLDVDNKDELLKPGMTAQVRLVTGERKDVLRIPTAALRFRLTDDDIKKAEKEKEKEKGKEQEKVVSAPAVADDIAFRSKEETTRVFRVYKLDAKNEAKPVDVKVGLSNFKFTEVAGGDLKKGEQIVTRYAAKASDE